jgi:hypothetical protein
MADKRAAISMDEIGDRTLAEVSAKDFLQVLKTEKKMALLEVWPEKKKVEMEVEPVLLEVTVRDLVDMLETLKGEKKKREYEFPELMQLHINPAVRPSLDERLDQISARLDAIAKRVGETR